MTELHLHPHPRYGLLDSDYEQASANGKKLWMIRADRTPTAWSGRYLVIVDFGSTDRPAWSLAPQQPGIVKGSVTAR